MHSAQAIFDEVYKSNQLISNSLDLLNKGIYCFKKVWEI